MKHKSSALFVCVVLVLFSASSLSASTIIAESAEENLHKYALVEMIDATWYEAEGDISEVLNSHYYLATITSQAEQDFIADFLDANGAVGQFWIGGFQNPLTTEEPGENWEWVTGEAWSYEKWSSGEPNDYYGSTTEQHLGMVSDRDWGWNDQDLINRWWINGYVAERSPITVCIDIKPDSYPNSINLGSEGVVPIAILGSSSFDVHDIDQTTVVFQGNAAREKGKSGKIGAFEDVNSDGYTDLVLQFPTQELDLSPDDTEGTLFGRLDDDTPIIGTDAVRIVPPSLGKNSVGQMLPTVYQLAPNVPNPFNPSTRITYALPEQVSVTLDVYNITGEKVASLVNTVQPQGVHSISWNGTNDSGQLVPSGIYIARLTAGSYTQTIRMVLLK